MSIHPLAVVSPGARLGVGVTVGPFATIESDVLLGDFSTVASGAVKDYTLMSKFKILVGFVE